jgi:hypothetical protein
MNLDSEEEEELEEELRRKEEEQKLKINQKDSTKFHINPSTND